MEEHRLVSPISIKIEAFGSPFSYFNYTSSHFPCNPAILRCFSLARSFNAKTLIVEEIPPEGQISEENEELNRLGFPISSSKVMRLSFWDNSISTESSIDSLQDDNLIGFAILKLGPMPGPEKTIRVGWHIFESVFKKYDHQHNCVPNPGKYQICVGDRKFHIKGVLYCQQNGLSKVCAHVALKSLLSRLVRAQEVSCVAMTQIAFPDNTYKPGAGLKANHIRAILNHYEILFHDLDYCAAEKDDPNVRDIQPYQKFLYAGIESGCGGLLGFSMDGPEAKNEAHIIPFYGHTFNKDTWVADAQSSYFNIGGEVGYIPSESWTSSFIGHDDNFGPNFCIPRLYVSPKNVQYVVEIKRFGTAYGGVVAEAQALQFLHSFHVKINRKDIWQNRLAQYLDSQKQGIVLRAICVNREQYLTHLANAEDWDKNKEDADFIKGIEKLLPGMLWVVEVSLPHLFPANERKLGEIVLNATREPDDQCEVDFSLFVLARLPSQFILIGSLTDGKPDWFTAPSGIQSDVEVLKH